MFRIAFRRIFAIVPLKFHQIIPKLLFSGVNTCWVIFSCKRRFSWFLLCWVILDYILEILCVMIWDFGSSLNLLFKQEVQPFRFRTHILAHFVDCGLNVNFPFEPLQYCSGLCPLRVTERPVQNLGDISHCSSILKAFAVLILPSLMLVALKRWTWDFILRYKRSFFGSLFIILSHFSGAGWTLSIGLHPTVSHHCAWWWREALPLLTLIYCGTGIDSRFKCKT